MYYEGIGYYFGEGINPDNPLSTLDPPPKDWRSITTRDYHFALLGRLSPLFMACMAWEVRENERVQRAEMLRCSGNPS